MPRLSEPRPGEGVAAKWGQDVAQAINIRRLAVHSDPEAADRLTLAATPSNTILTLRANPCRMFFGIIKSAGPSSEADYTDERYWVKEIAVANSSGTPTARLTLTEMTYSTNPAVHKRCRWKTVSNLFERVDGTHFLTAGMHVGPVWQVRDSRGVAHWIFARAVQPQTTNFFKLSQVSPSVSGYPLTNISGTPLAPTWGASAESLVHLGNGCIKVDDPVLAYKAFGHWAFTSVYAHLKGA